MPVSSLKSYAKTDENFKMYGKTASSSLST